MLSRSIRGSLMYAVSRQIQFFPDSETLDAEGIIDSTIENFERMWSAFAEHDKLPIAMMILVKEAAKREKKNLLRDRKEAIEFLEKLFAMTR